MSGGSIGTVLGGIFGAILAPFTGGASALVGFSLGATIGGIIGGLLDPPKSPQQFGPRLSDLTQQTATYGAVIPDLSGTATVFGNVFWIENNKLKEVATTEEQGGKGGPSVSQTTYTYYGTFAVGLCANGRAIQQIKKIWISGKLYYNVDTDDEFTLIQSNDVSSKFAVYLGTETQLPDPRMEANVGTANCPGYRGLAYIVFYDLDVTNFGNSIAGMQIKVEVMADGAPGYVASLKTSSIAGAGNANSIDIAPDFGTLYSCERDFIAVWDIADTQTITLKGRLNRTSTNNYICKYFGGYLFVSTNISQTIDRYNVGIQQGGTPLYVDSITPSAGSAANGLYIDGAFMYACIASPSNSLFIYSMVQGAAPNFVGSVSGLSTNPRAVYVSGNYAYIYCQAANSINIVDITSKTAPSLVGSVGYGATSTNECQMVKVGNYLYSMGFGGISIFNVTTPSAPTAVANALLSTTNPAGIAYRNGYLIISYGSSVSPFTQSVSIVSIANPISPSIVFTTTGGFSDGSTSYKNIILTKDYLYQSERLNGAVDSRAIRQFFIGFKQVSTNPTLSSIVEHYALKSNILTSGDLNTTALTQTVKGYKVASTGAIRSTIEPLQGVYPFDVIQDGYQIKFLVRGGSSVATIPSTELDARQAGDKTGVKITNSREMDNVLPSKVSIKYEDFNREYDINEQYAERINTDAVNTMAIEIPLVSTAQEMARACYTLLYLYWMERFDISFKLPQTRAALQPGDVITITDPAYTYNLRLKQINYNSDGTIDCMAKYNHAPLYTQAVTGEEGTAPSLTLSPAGNTLFELLDIPCLQDTYDKSGYPIALTGQLSGWPGGVLMRSDDGGHVYSNVQAIVSPGATMGYATNTISSPASTGIIDKASVLNVRTYHSATLSSVSEGTMLNGSNHFAYGINGRYEIIAAQNCVLQSDGTYNLSDLLRGRFGTEIYTGTHAINDVVVLLTSAQVKFISFSTSNIGLLRHYKGVTVGKSVDIAAAKTFTYNGVNLEPLSPVYLNAWRNFSTGDINLSWIRRGRINNEWKDLIDVPVGETSESYEVDIYSDNTFTTLKRTLAVSTNTAVYTSAQQITDFGATSGDPLRANRQLLLHCNGANNGTVFTDNSTFTRTVTANGNAKTSTTQIKFGTTSAAFDGAGDFIKLGANTISPFTTQNWCVEFWLWVVALPGANGCRLFQTVDGDITGAIYTLLNSAGALGFASSSAGATFDIINFTTANGYIGIGAWNHLAFVRNGSQFTIYLNGVGTSAGTSSASLLNNTAHTWTFGGQTPGIDRSLNGFMDEIIVTLGNPVYTANFTPTTTETLDVFGTTSLSFKTYQLSSTVGRGYSSQETIITL